jgi:hypothetical protein
MIRSQSQLKITFTKTLTCQMYCKGSFVRTQPAIGGIDLIGEIRYNSLRQVINR